MVRFYHAMDAHTVGVLGVAVEWKLVGYLREGKGKERKGRGRKGREKERRWEKGDGEGVGKSIKDNKMQDIETHLPHLLLLVQGSLRTPGQGRACLCKQGEHNLSVPSATLLDTSASYPTITGSKTSWMVALLLAR